MKAIAIDRFGNRSELKSIQLEKPIPGSGEVLIKVHAAGVNPVDWKIREGWLQSMLPHQFPIVLGWDCAGEVEAVGEGVTAFRPTDEVFGYVRKATVQFGTYCEYVVAAAQDLAHKPRNMTFEEAASVPLAALTAWQVLREAASVKRGESILIHAAAGGVGIFAVQLAREWGLEIAATGLTRNHEFIRRLGAQHVLDYTRGDFRELIKEFYPTGVDVAFDAVGGDVLLRSADVVKQTSGRLVSIVRSPIEEQKLPSGLAYSFVFVRPDGGQLAELSRLIEAGHVRTFLSNVFPLDEAARAHEQLEGGHTRGKIVLRVC